MNKLDLRSNGIIMKSSFGLILLLAVGVYSEETYSEYQVLRFTPHNETVISRLSLLLQRPEFEFWSIPRVGRNVDVMTSPEYVHELHEVLLHLGVKFSVIVSDVEWYLKNEREERETLKWETDLVKGNLTFERYMEFDEILDYLDTVVTQYPDIASIEEIGTSFEGRPIVVIKLSNGPKDTAIFFDSGIHACEWAGPPVSLYAINELTENLAVNPGMLDKVDFYFLPIANPDGYIFAHEKRLWRKTRQPHRICTGTDPNRNWDWPWAQDDPKGECSIQYPGPHAFSEPGIKAIADFLTRNQYSTSSHSIHSFGNYFLHPWGDTTDIPTNNEELARIGKLATDALYAVNGTEYLVGSISHLLYVAYGGVSDYMYGAQNCLHAYTIELPGGGNFGFDLPVDRILPVATETWEAIKVLANNVPEKRNNATIFVIPSFLLAICVTLLKMM